MLSVSISFGNQLELKPDPGACQDNPRRHYVYGHLDNCGNYFYIGKGTGKRAWARDRHPLWQQYVQKHLLDLYTVHIIKDNLSVDEAEELESRWIFELGENLINWANPRCVDYKAADRIRRLRSAIDKIVLFSKSIEGCSTELALRCYEKTYGILLKCRGIRYHKGLLGKILLESEFDTSRFGDIRILDRLTICLTRLKRYEEARSKTNHYFSCFPGDLGLNASETIKRRVNKIPPRHR